MLDTLLTYWGRDEMAAYFLTTISIAFSWMKIYHFRLIFHWSLFPRVQLTKFQHWFRWWLVAWPAPSRYLNQCWNIVLSMVSLLTHISMISCLKGPTRHTYAWQIGPFWQDTLDMRHSASMNKKLNTLKAFLRDVHFYCVRFLNELCSFPVISLDWRIYMTKPHL